METDQERRECELKEDLERLEDHASVLAQAMRDRMV